MTWNQIRARGVAGVKLHYYKGKRVCVVLSVGTWRRKVVACKRKVRDERVDDIVCDGSGLRSVR